MGKIIDITRKRDKLISDSIADLSSSLPDVQKEVWKRINKFLQSLETDRDGNLKATTKNLKAINTFANKDIKAIIKKSKYPTKVNKFIETFGFAGDLTKKYFDELENA